ncbi:unnamed protein product [Calypogeia fissa]
MDGNTKDGWVAARRELVEGGTEGDNYRAENGACLVPRFGGSRMATERSVRGNCAASSPPRTTEDQRGWNRAALLKPRGESRVAPDGMQATEVRMKRTVRAATQSKET